MGILSVAISHVTAEASASARQADRAFSGALNTASASLLLDHLDHVGIRFSLIHPAGSSRSPKRGSFSKRDKTYYLPASLPYVAWATGDWSVRVSLMADEARQVLHGLPATRVSRDEKGALSSAIDAAEVVTLASAPQSLEPVGSIHLIYDESGERSGSPPGVSFSDIGIPRSGRIVEVRVSEISAIDWDALMKRQVSDERSFKFYRRGDATLSYREAWIDDANAVTDHRGDCGDRGETQVRPFSDRSAARRFYEELKVDARRAGFRAIPESRHRQIVVDLADDGTRSLIDRRHALEDFLNEELGWLGLGHCDGGDIGGGTASAFSFVVDYKLAEASLRERLKHSPFADFKAIRRGAS